MLRTDADGNETIVNSDFITDPALNDLVQDYSPYCMTLAVPAKVTVKDVLCSEGQLVEVVHGPLKGVVGRLVRKNDKARLVLAVDLIGQAVSVDVDAADVRGM